MIAPPTPGSRISRTFVGALFVAWLFAACGGSGVAGTTTPASATIEPYGDPATGASSTADPVLAPTGPTACLGLGPEDCARAHGIAAATVPGDDRPVRYVQVGPFGCATGDACPMTLEARPEGDVTIEFDGGEALNVHLRIEPDGTAQTEPGEAFGVIVEPTSAPGLTIGPMPFTLGHCGVFSGIDVDAAWWDPVGPVPMDSGDAVNAVSGVLTVVDRGHATFTTSTGFAVQLQRREGSKFLPLCQ
jgi:hypothetical protein